MAAFSALLAVGLLRTAPAVSLWPAQASPATRGRPLTMQEFRSPIRPDGNLALDEALERSPGQYRSSPPVQYLGGPASRCAYPTLKSQHAAHCTPHTKHGTRYTTAHGTRHTAQSSTRHYKVAQGSELQSRQSTV